MIEYQYLYLIAVQHFLLLSILPSSTFLRMDPTLSFDEDIKQVVLLSMKKLNQINRIKHLFMRHILEMIIQSCVFSKLFYCSTVWSATSHKNISKLAVRTKLRSTYSNRHSQIQPYNACFKTIEMALCQNDVPLLVMHNVHMHE